MHTFKQPLTIRSSSNSTQQASSLAGSASMQAGFRWRVLIVDDHTSIREMIRVILDGYSDLIEVVGEASDGDEAVAQAKLTPVDLVLLNTQLPDMNSVSAAKHMRQVAPHAVILGMSAEYTPYVHNAMIAAGAVGVVRMEDAADLLFRSIVFAMCTYSPTHAHTNPNQMALRRSAESFV